MKDGVRRFKILIYQSHAVEGFIIKDIDTASSIHEYLGELVPPNLRCHHQCKMTQIMNLGWMILSTPHNGLFRPALITGHYWFNRVYYPFMKILIALTQTSGEDMVLTTIQLLQITLITRLLLPLTPLMIITALVALTALIATRPMRTAS